MNREEPQFYNAYELPWGGSPGMHEITHGLETRLLSRNSTTGATTYMLRIPAGWRATLTGDEETVECFILEGDLAVNDLSLGSTGFVGIPQMCGPVRLSSQQGAVVYAFATPDMPLPTYTSGIKASQIWNDQWVHVEMDHVRHGLMFKPLRTPDPATGELHGGPSGFMRLTLMTPGFMEARHEVHHNCWEEIIVLRGELMMKDRGLQAGGTYLGNPASLWHAPFATHGGCLILIHCDAPMDVAFRNYPGGYQAMRDHIEGSSWIEEAPYAVCHPPVALQTAAGGTAHGKVSESGPPPVAADNGARDGQLPGAPTPSTAPEHSSGPSA